MLRRLFLFVAMLHCGICSFAQMKQGQALIDSLKGELPRHGDDTMHVLIQAQLTNIYTPIDADEALRRADSAIALAGRLHYNYGHGKALMAKGTLFNSRNRPEEARPFYQEALSLFRACGDKAHVAMALGNIGLTYANTNLDKAIGSVEGAVATLESMGEGVNKVNLSRGYTFAGNLYKAKGQLDKALQSYRRGLSIDSVMGNAGGISGEYANIAAIHTLRSEYAQAVAYFTKSIEIARALGNKQNTAAQLAALSGAYQAQSDYPHAIAAAQEALDIQESIGTNDGTAMITLAKVFGAAGDYPKAEEWLRKASEAALKYGNKSNAAEAIYNLSTVYALQSNYPKALNANQSALRMFEEAGDPRMMAAICSQIADNYLNGLKDREQAADYFHRSIALFAAAHDTADMILPFTSLANMYSGSRQPDSAMHYALLAVPIAEKTGTPTTRALLYQVMGDAWFAKGDKLRTLDAYVRGKVAADKSGEKSQISLATFDRGWSYGDVANDTTIPLPAGYGLPPSRKAWRDSGIAEMRKALVIQMVLGNVRGMQENLSYISEAEAAGGYYKEALATYKEHIRYRDSLYNTENTKRFLRQEMDYASQKAQDSLKAVDERRELALKRDAALAALHYEYERKQAGAKTEAERTKYKNEEALRRQQIIDEHNYSAANLERQRQREAAIAKAEADKRADIAAAELKRRQSLVYASYAGGALLLVGAIVAMLAWRAKRRDAGIITAERERSEALLRNILPAEVAEELKAGGAAAARQYDEVSVLFTDFVNFSGASERLSPQALVQELHECFSAFDAICERHGLEKIKTIGDAYMAVCGLPQANVRHAQAAVAAAIDIRDFVGTRLAAARSDGAAHPDRAGMFQIRIGIHSGPVVAGIVGVMKYAYDVWGDTVNTAARLEQHSEPGRINVSASTYSLIRQDYPCTYRGELSAKNKGEIAMYFVEAPVTQKVLQAA